MRGAWLPCGMAIQIWRGSWVVSPWNCSAVSRQNTACGTLAATTTRPSCSETGWPVQATPDPVQQTSGGQACQDDPGHVDGVQIAGAQQPLLAGQIEDALAVGAGGHGRIMFHVFAKCSIWEKNRNTLRLRPGYPMR